MFINIPTTVDILAQYTDTNFTNDYLYNQLLTLDIIYDFFTFQTALLETTFFLEQLNNTNILNEVENIRTIYHYSVPNTKLYYPEPFLAAASFMHTDLWFVHILIYQYWLWFVFVFMIVFFFLTFICILRWCNIRVRPRRETRGVSRSKCGDLITACVPVSWATSIIVNESADAIDYYDGFGTSELVVGIRAYQWGWEYYYPKDIDLNYQLKTNNSVFLGNSLKYNKMTELSLSTNKLWKYYQTKAGDGSVTPAHLLLLPTDNNKLLHFNNFNDIGLSNLVEANAFKRIKLFSKTTTTPLYALALTNTRQYSYLSNNLSTNLVYLQSYLYGLKRQHNFITSHALLNNLNTFFDLNSLNKYIQFNLHSVAFNSTVPFTSVYNLYYNNTFVNNFSTMFTNNRVKQIFDELGKADLSTNKQNFAFSLMYPLYTLLQNDAQNQKLLSAVTTENTSFNNLLLNNWSGFISSDSNFPMQKLLTEQNTFTPLNLYLLTNKVSTNITYGGKERTLRHTLSTTPNSSLLNFNNPLLETESALYTQYLNTLSGDSNINLVSRYLTNRVFFDTPYAPITSTNPLVSSLNFDSSKHSTVEDLPMLLQGKEDLSPTFVFSTYWTSTLQSSIADWEYNGLFNVFQLNNIFYYPLITLYYDYDFRNLQALELVEDAFWENVYPIANYEEYLELGDFFNNYHFCDKYENFFNNADRALQLKDGVLFKPFIKDFHYKDAIYPTALYFDETISVPNLVITENALVPSLLTTLNLFLDDSYENFKFYTALMSFNNTNTFLYNLITTHPHSVTTLFDCFRSDYEDFSWYIDNWGADNFYCPNTLFVSQLLTYPLLATTFNNGTNSLAHYTHRLTNYINHVGTVKNAMVTQNAMQKVFRSRFDEGRSYTNLLTFADFENRHPFITATAPIYQNLLGKNKDGFFDVNLYKANLIPLNDTYALFSNALNFYCYDFPFLVAQKSDASRYLWFDWYTKWQFVEVQPSSQSRYALYGMPYFSKVFEFNTNMSDVYNESENYFSRLSRARQNYLPAWTYTPYFYARANVWYADNLLVNLFNSFQEPLLRVQYLLLIMDWYWTSLFFININNYLFFSGHSMLTTYGKAGWQPIESIQSYYFNVSYLIDVLVKREYLYRQLLESHNKIINLPINLTATPKHPLINELKALYLFMDPIVYNNEYSRDIIHQSLSLFNLYLVKPLLLQFCETINLSSLWTYGFSYFFNNTGLADINALHENSSLELQKNQYRPLRKGISNMIRIHATGAIAMPIEVRIQLLISSKDVIHSWAIPSAGIKLDCVPGYSSHKTMIFLLSGIFWGQCMEICGRYHHWMPIVIYFMKRDLFFLWCLHFVFLSNNNQTLDMMDRLYADKLHVVSFDKLSWLSELNQLK